MCAHYTPLFFGAHKVSLTLFTYTTCLSNEGAIKLAKLIVNAIEQHEKEEDTK